MRVAERLRRLEVARFPRALTDEERRDRDARLERESRRRAGYLNDGDAAIPLAVRLDWQAIDHWGWALRFDPSPPRFIDIIRLHKSHAQ